jgi:hypothetical protein
MVTNIFPPEASRVVVGFGSVDEGSGVEMAIVVLDERRDGWHGLACSRT